MATITLKYDARNTIANNFIDLAISLEVFKVDKNPKSGLQSAIEAADSGDYFTAKG